VLYLNWVCTYYLGVQSVRVYMVCGPSGPCHTICWCLACDEAVVSSRCATCAFTRHHSAPPRATCMLSMHEKCVKKKPGMGCGSRASGSACAVRVVWLADTTNRTAVHGHCGCMSTTMHACRPSLGVCMCVYGRGTTIRPNASLHVTMFCCEAQLCHGLCCCQGRVCQGQGVGCISDVAAWQKLVQGGCEVVIGGYVCGKGPLWLGRSLEAGSGWSAFCEARQRVTLKHLCRWLCIGM
jgi:hypothetical protein